MNLFETKNIILIDATSMRVKTLSAKNGATQHKYESQGQSMESCTESLAKVCDDFSAIDAYAICTGPGSVLGTRVASAAVATIANMHESAILQYDAMQAAAFAFAESSHICEFSIIAPSRKGFVNILNFANSAIESEAETELADLENSAKAVRRLLRQKTNIDTSLGVIEEFDPDMEQIFSILKRRPDIAEKCELPPDAKSLSKREYVKWKVQAHI